MVVVAPGGLVAAPATLSSCGFRSSFAGERLQVSGCGLGQKAQQEAVDSRRTESRFLGVRAQAGSFNHIPKQFRQDGLKDGLTQNFETCPPSLYGLSPSQMDTFMVENNPYQRQAERVTEASISSASRYQDGTGMWSATGLDGAPSRLSMSAFGQAAMLLSLGEKGYRALQPSSSTKLYSPKVNQSSGSSTDMWIKGKELDANTDYYIDLLASGTGKSKEVIANDIRRPRYFRPQEAVDYGLADKIIEPRGIAMEKRNYDEMLAQSKAARASYTRPGAAASAGAGGR